MEKAGKKLSPEKLTELMDKGDFLSAEECISYGLADKYAVEGTGSDNAAAIVKTQSGAQQSLQSAQQLPIASQKLPVCEITQTENAKALKAWNALLGAFSN